MPGPHGLLVTARSIACALWVALAWAGTAVGQSSDPPEVPELVIPEELRIEADRIEAEEDAARAARENAEEEQALRGDDPSVPIPRFEEPVRRLSDLDRDERSIERLRIDCRNEISRRDVTLFANGTIRLRHGPWEDPQMLLEELGPEELTVYLKQLARIRRSDEFPRPDPRDVVEIEGNWLNACRLTLEVPGDSPVTLFFNSFEMQPLPIGRLVQIADELASFTRPLEAPDRLPVGYEPQAEDVLRRRDGALFRVISPTDDGDGVELESLVEPLTVYYRIEDLPRIFATRLDGVSNNELEERLLAEPEVLNLEDRDRGFSAWGRPVEPWDRDPSPPAEEVPTYEAPADEPEEDSEDDVEDDSEGAGRR